MEVNASDQAEKEVIDFYTALRAKIPFIGITTDDPVHVRDVLQLIAQKDLKLMPTATASPLEGSYLYWTDDLKSVSTDSYRKYASFKSNHSCRGCGHS